MPERVIDGGREESSIDVASLTNRHNYRHQPKVYFCQMSESFIFIQKLCFVIVIVIISRSSPCGLRRREKRKGDFALEKMTTNTKAQQNNNNEIPFTQKC